MLQKVVTGIQLDLAGLLSEDQIQIVTQVVKKHLASLSIEEDTETETKRSDSFYRGQKSRGVFRKVASIL